MSDTSIEEIMALVDAMAFARTNYYSDRLMQSEEKAYEEAFRESRKKVESAIKSAILESVSSSYEECARIVDEEGGGAAKYYSQAIRQHSQKGKSE